MCFFREEEAGDQDEIVGIERNKHEYQLIIISVSPEDGSVIGTVKYEQRQDDEQT